ncbi:hypothetical protein K0B96_10465 [Horticoccus luteus]|uniref:Uncharacterized protein n=1 Tax=Horticoccus luteus TaxID=2862869 RepID=A0A8F9TTZ8_9BACT|nr:hypothetical protein [Horticoccus luteus]QYM77748.1 hypothetical protein K0B96_10465 [Horticoccus luteus]
MSPRSHRPHRFPQRTDAQIEKLVLAERRLHRTWGPKKIQDLLETKHGVERPPACSTIGEILRRHGQSVKRRRRPGVYPALNQALTVPNQPNQVWTVDFKGWFLLGNNQRCDPLTICDRYSHYVMAVRGQPDQQFRRTLGDLPGAHAPDRPARDHPGGPWIALRLDRAGPALRLERGVD